MSGRTENLKPWKPGQSGNPGGRPKRDMAQRAAWINSRWHGSWATVPHGLRNATTFTVTEPHVMTGFERFAEYQAKGIVSAVKQQTDAVQ